MTFILEAMVDLVRFETGSADVALACSALGCSFLTRRTICLKSSDLLQSNKA